MCEAATFQRTCDWNVKRSRSHCLLHDSNLRTDICSALSMLDASRHFLIKIRQPHTRVYQERWKIVVMSWQLSLSELIRKNVVSVGLRRHVAYRHIGTLQLGLGSMLILVGLRRAVPGSGLPPRHSSRYARVVKYIVEAFLS